MISEQFILIGLGLFSGNGYIEGTELDAFLKEFVGSVTSTESGPEVSDMVEKLK